MQSYYDDLDVFSKQLWIKPRNNLKAARKLIKLLSAILIVTY
jgi:hypothetical protein